MPYFKFTIFRGLGATLGQLVKEGAKATFKDILIIGLQLLDRLERLHKIGVVYRRLTLSTIMLGCDKGDLSHVLHLIDYNDCDFFN